METSKIDSSPDSFDSKQGAAAPGFGQGGFGQQQSSAQSEGGFGTGGFGAQSSSQQSEGGFGTGGFGEVTNEDNSGVYLLRSPALKNIGVSYQVHNVAEGKVSPYEYLKFGETNNWETTKTTYGDVPEAYTQIGLWRSQTSRPADFYPESSTSKSDRDPDQEHSQQIEQRLMPALVEHGLATQYAGGWYRVRVGTAVIIGANLDVEHLHDPTTYMKIVGFIQKYTAEVMLTPGEEQHYQARLCSEGLNSVAAFHQKHVGEHSPPAVGGTAGQPYPAGKSSLGNFQPTTQPGGQSKPEAATDEQPSQTEAGNFQPKAPSDEEQMPERQTDEHPSQTEGDIDASDIYDDDDQN